MNYSKGDRVIVVAGWVGAGHGTTGTVVEPYDNGLVKTYDVELADGQTRRYHAAELAPAPLTDPEVYELARLMCTRLATMHLPVFLDMVGHPEAKRAVREAVADREARRDALVAETSCTCWATSSNGCPVHFVAGS